MSSWLRRLSRDRGIRDGGHATRTQTGDSNQHRKQKDTQYTNGHVGRDGRLVDQTGRSAPDEDGTFVYAPAAGHSSRTRARSITVGADRARSQSETREKAPSPLVRAFNDALQPYQDEIDELRLRLEDALYRVSTLEDERADMHAWIDKRGLRADVPPSIFQAMGNDAAAAQILNYQLDRKMTVLNHDLHRLQDSLSTQLPTATFSTTLAQLLPAIEDLATLPMGAPLAFELVVKLGGNLNSHGSEGGWNNDADAASRTDFFAQLDACMTDIVKLRVKDLDHQSTSAPLEDGHGLEPSASGQNSNVHSQHHPMSQDTKIVDPQGQRSNSGAPASTPTTAHFPPGGGQGDNWSIDRDIRRLEKTGAFLRSKLGLKDYFPLSLEMMKSIEEARRDPTLPLQRDRPR